MTGRTRPDWRDPWPVTGVRQGDPEPSRGVEALRAAGYRYVADVEAIESDHDPWQDHLNNTAPPRMFNELRIAYVAANLAPDWPRLVRREGLAVVVRELHLRYDSEASVTERFVGSLRVAGRRRKVVFLEQQLVEASTARRVASAWLVQLVARDGRAVEWPHPYWELAAAAEGHPIPEVETGRFT